MENNEGFKGIVAKLKALEQSLAQCDIDNNLFELSGKEAERIIEEQFAMLTNALAARKASLLRELEQARETNKKDIINKGNKLRVVIGACKKTIDAGALMYAVDPNMALNIWEGFAGLPVSHTTNLQIHAELTHNLVDYIRNYGQVITFSSTIGGSFARVESINTFAGALPAGNRDGVGFNVKFNSPYGMCYNPHNECLYVADTTNNSIKTITLQGEVMTIVPNIKSPRAIAIDLKENLIYVSSDNHIITKVTADGTQSVLAGNGSPGHVNGAGTNASFHVPYGIAVDQQTGNLYVSDYSNHVILQITPQGIVSTFAGSTKGCVDGNAATAKFNYPHGIAWEGQSMLVCDYVNDKIRRVTLNGIVSTLCDIPRPRQIAITANKTIFVTSYNNTIYKITCQGEKYAAVALTGDYKTANFNNPTGIIVHEASNSCFVADFQNHVIKKISFAD